MVSIKRGVQLIARRLKRDERPLEEAEHLWMEDEKEMRTFQRQQLWEPSRRPGWRHKMTGTVGNHFKEIMTGSCMCLRTELVPFQ